MKIDIFPNVFHERFSVSTPQGDSVLVKRGYRGCPISFLNKVTLVDSVELDMLDFDVIFWMDFLYFSFSSIDCKNRVVKFKFLNEPIFSGKGETLPKNFMS